ncbi:MAG: hypothetical protein NTU74_17880 [Deltaproteobacteria bacterium]|nr:hypothetical protein [Deltaproteobacteria bacterium]
MKFLVIGEAVTLAHIVRPLKISQALTEMGHDVCFATDIREFGKFISINPKLRFRPLPSIGTQFLTRTRNRQRPYSNRDIENYLLNDRKIMDIEKPDCIIHDFRISMNLLRGLGHYICPIVDAYWATVPGEVFTLPPPQPGIFAKIAYLFPASVRGIFGCVVDHAGAGPFDRAARSLGIRPLHRFSKYLLSGDHILLAASAETFPTIRPKINHAYLGHIEWTPDTELNESIADLEYDIYLSLGSSGPAEQIPVMLKWLAELNLRTLLCTGTKHDSGKYNSGQVYVRQFVDGKDAAQRARVTICNGGSPSVYQALSAGCPVLGITSNPDQALCMRAFSNKEYVKSIPLALLKQKSFISNLTSLLNGHNRSMIKNTVPYSDIKANLPKFDELVKNQKH